MSVGLTGAGRDVDPSRYSSIAAAAALPSAIAQTIRLAPLPASPATNTPSMFVAYFWFLAKLDFSSVSTEVESTEMFDSGPVKPSASKTRSASMIVSVPDLGTLLPSMNSVSATSMPLTLPFSPTKRTVLARYLRSPNSSWALATSNRFGNVGQG